MSGHHRAPDGRVCHVLLHGRHGVVRVFGCVSWEASAFGTCPTLSTGGTYECFKCNTPGMEGNAADAAQHARTCIGRTR